MLRRITLVTAASSIGLAFVVTDVTLSMLPGVTEANVKRIQSGMNMKDVETILGAPGIFLRSECSAYNAYRWDRVHGSAMVYVDDTGLVAGAAWRPAKSSPGFINRARAWLVWW